MLVCQTSLVFIRIKYSSTMVKSCLSMCATASIGKRISAGLTPLSALRNTSTPRIRTTSGLQPEASALQGGLSVTACLADFSLYIFHPYGGGQKKTTLSSLENAFRRTLSGYL